MCASERGHKEIVSMLLSAGAQVNQEDKVSGVNMHNKTEDRRSAL